MSQKGFTLIEIVVVMGLLGAIMVVFLPTIRQVVLTTREDRTEFTALTQVESAARWLGRDIPAGYSTDLVNGAAPVNTMSVHWTDWSQTSNYDVYNPSGVTPVGQKVAYSSSGTDLVRQYSTCSNWDTTTQTCSVSWVLVSAKTVAMEITTAEFSVTDKLVQYTLASFPEGSAFRGETRTYQTLMLSSVASVVQ